MNGGVQNRLLAAFPAIHINQVVCCELIPEEKGKQEAHVAGGTGPSPACLGEQQLGSDCVWKVS